MQKFSNLPEKLQNIWATFCQDLSKNPNLVALNLYVTNI